MKGLWNPRVSVCGQFTLFSKEKIMMLLPRLEPTLSDCQYKFLPPDREAGTTRSSHGHFFELRFTAIRTRFFETLVALCFSETIFRLMIRLELIELSIISVSVFKTGNFGEKHEVLQNSNQFRS